MAVTLTTMQAQDSLATSRLTINGNFSAVKAAIDASQLLLDPTTSILSGVKSATINDAAVSLSTTIFTVSKAGAILGNLALGTSGQSTSVLVLGNGGFTIDQSTLTLNLGGITLGGTASLFQTAGNISVSREVRFPGVAAAYSAIIGLTAASTTVNVTDKKYVVLRNDSTTAGLTASLSAGTPGQIMEIVHTIGASGFPVYISALNFSGLTGSINLTQTADSIKCVYEGASWYLLNYSAASFATTVGPTGSSITFTTL